MNSTRFSGTSPAHLILRTDNGPQYIASVFQQSVKLMGIGQEYIQKQTPEDNGDIESLHSSHLRKFLNKSNDLDFNG